MMMMMMISYALQRGILLPYVEKIPHVRIGAADRCSEAWF